MDLFVSNVKLSCKIVLTKSDRISFNMGNSVKKYDNFTVVKNKYVYIVFTKSRLMRQFHVNITKIPSMEHVPRAMEELKQIINEDFFVKEYRVENLTCLHNLNMDFNLAQIFQIYEQKYVDEILKMRYNPEKFPGMFITLKNCTVLLFSSGKIVVIGAASEEHAKNGINSVFKLLKVK